MSDLQQIKDWIASEAALPCQIWCEDPELNKGGMFGKSFLTYRILSRQVGHDLVGVRRRYSDFEKVQKDLKERYSALGILVPALPPKKMMGSSSQESAFIKERTQGLTLFCDCVASNPFLRNDAKWRDFIRPDSTPYDSSADNTGEIMLEKALKLLEQPFKFTMTTRMDTVKDEVKSVEKQIDTMITALRALQTAEKAYLASSENVTNILQTWMETESQKVKSLGGYPFDCAESIVQTRDTVTSTLETTHRLNTSKVMRFAKLSIYPLIFSHHHIALIRSHTHIRARAVHGSLLRSGLHWRTRHFAARGRARSNRGIPRTAQAP